MGEPRNFYTAHGFTRSLSQWSRRLGVPYQTLQKRIRSGMPLERALSAGSLAIRRDVTINGETRTLQQWADAAGLHPTTLSNRLLAGEEPAVAIARPAHHGAVARPLEDRRRSEANRTRDRRMAAVLARVATINARAAERARNRGADQ